jgi:hypothetical protein
MNCYTNYHSTLLVEFIPYDMLYVSKAHNKLALRVLYEKHILKSAEEYNYTLLNKFKKIEFGTFFNDDIDISKLISMIFHSELFSINQLLYQKV